MLWETIDQIKLICCIGGCFTVVLRKSFVFLLVMFLVLNVLSVSGCTKDEGPGLAGGNFESKENVSDVFVQEGNATVSLESDETFDMTGIVFTGRKEFFLNDHTLKLTGIYKVSTEAILDIKPGEGFTKGAIDMSGLEIDISGIDMAAMQEDLAIIEIAAGPEIVAPEGNEEVAVRELPHGGLRALLVLKQQGDEEE